MRRGGVTLRRHHPRRSRARFSSLAVAKGEEADAAALRSSPKHAGSARKTLAHAMQKARGMMADMAWLMLVLPPERVKKVLGSGHKELTDAERVIMEGFGKVGHEPMPGPHGRQGETFGLRALGALQGALWEPVGTGGPSMRLVLMTGYEPGDGRFFLPSGKLVPPIRRVAPLRGHGRGRRAGTSAARDKAGSGGS